MDISTIKIKDLKATIFSMNPIKLYLDNRLVWDENTDKIDFLFALLERYDFVSELCFKVVDFHHSIVYITTRTY